MKYIKWELAKTIEEDYRSLGDKVDAIKRVRGLLICSLKEAKEIVESGFLWSNFGYTVITKEGLMFHLVRLSKEFYEVGAALQSNMFDD